MAPKYTKSLDDYMLEDIDFEVVKECKDKKIIARFLKLLEDDGHHFPDLEKAVKAKWFDLDPKAYYQRFPLATSAEAIDDATRDLLEWESNVKETDKALLATSRTSKKDVIWDDPLGSNRIAAPIRGQEAQHEEAKMTRRHAKKALDNVDARPEPQTETEKYARDKVKMKDYYGAWDNVDVDAMEADFDQQEKDEEEAKLKHFEDMREEQREMNEVGAIDESVAAADVPAVHRKHLADTEKEKGNEAFYAKDFAEAESYYTRSIQFGPDDPSAWANRALARLKLGRADGAVVDCNHALALNPRYMKALHRKGKALTDLKQYREAVECFQMALQLSPGNTQINGDLLHARRGLRSLGDEPPEEKQKSGARPVEDVPDYDAPKAGSMKSSDQVSKQAPPGERAGYTRVQIEEGSDSESDSGAPTAPASGFTRVQIDEDSDSESDAGVPEKGPAASTGGFTRVQIEEVGDSESEADDKEVERRGKAAQVKATSPKFAPPPRVPQEGSPPRSPDKTQPDPPSETLSFDDMD